MLKDRVKIGKNDGDLRLFFNIQKSDVMIKI